MQIITREEWGAAYAAGFGPAPLPAREVWLHHSVTVAPDLVPPYDDEVDAMRQLEHIGQDRFGGGISYTFAVMPTGRVYEGTGVDRQGAHTKGRNSIARAIVLVGNYDTHQPTPAQLTSCAQLLVDGWRVGWWDEPRLDGGHQQAPGAATACPGRYGMAAVAAINQRATVLAAGGHPTKEDDMPLTDQDADHVAQRARQVLIDGTKGWSLTTISRRVSATARQVQEIDEKLDDVLALVHELAKGR